MTSFQCSFISLSAIRKPYLKNGKYNLIIRDIMRKKIEMIFRTAIIYGINSYQNHIKSEDFMMVNDKKLIALKL